VAGNFDPAVITVVAMQLGAVNVSGLVWLGGEQPVAALEAAAHADAEDQEEEETGAEEEDASDSDASLLDALYEAFRAQTPPGDSTDSVATSSARSSSSSSSSASSSSPRESRESSPSPVRRSGLRDSMESLLVDFIVVHDKVAELRFNPKANSICAHFPAHGFGCRRTRTLNPGPGDGRHMLDIRHQWSSLTSRQRCGHSSR